MKATLETLRRDPLLRSLFIPGRPLDRAGFLVMIPFVIFLQKMSIHFFSTPVLTLPLIFWFWFVIIDGRLLHSGKRMITASVILAVILALCTTMTFELLNFSPLQFGPLMIHNAVNVLGSLERIVSYTSLGLGITHITLAVSSLTIIIILAVIPGFGESSLSLFKEEDNTSLFSITGDLSRERLILFTLARSAITVLLLLLYTGLIALLEGPGSLTDMSWIGGNNTGFLAGVAVTASIIIILLNISILTLYTRRLHAIGRSRFWVLLLFPVILIGSGLHPALIRVLIPYLASRFGSETLVFTNIWVTPIVFPVIITIRSLMLLALAFLYLTPKKKITSAVTADQE